MNFLKRSWAKQEFFKKKGVRKWRNFLCGAVILAAALGLAWHYFPMYHAGFYLTRAAVHTRSRLVKLWGKDQGEGDAYEESLKLVADEVKWNGRSVLVLPGGFGISWKEQRNERNTFTQGSLDVYFLGSVRQGADYWADQQRIKFTIPGIAETPVNTTQENLKNIMGFSVIPQKKEQTEADMDTLLKDAVKMIMESQIAFEKREEGGVEIKAEVPAALFDSYLAEAGEFLEKSSAKDLKEWGQLLKERRTEAEVQEIFFTVDKKLNITGIWVKKLGAAKMSLDSGSTFSANGDISLSGREFLFDAQLSFGNGQKGKRTFQIPKLNITYNKENFRLGLELSGGYEGGKISSEVLEYDALEKEEGGQDDGGKEAKERFLEKIGKLGFDFDEKDIDK